MTDIVFRKALFSDLDEICLVVSYAIKEMEKNNIFQWDRLYPTREFFIKDIEGGGLYVGESDNKIVSFFVINQHYEEEYNTVNWTYPEKNFYVVHRLCVNPIYQRKGIGKQTVKFIEEVLSGMGIEAIRLDVYGKNPYAIRLYESMDFKKVGSVNWSKGKFYLMEKYL